MINSGNNNGNNRATGGPVAGGQPYIVGERGPELIVPQHNGYVIPAGPTAAMMGGLGHAASRFGGYREEGGPVQPSTAYVAGEAGPEVIVPTSRELNAKGDAQGKTADEHAMRGIAQVFLPGQVAPGLVNMGRGIVGSGQAMRSYLQANDQRGREEAARPPVYVEQPPVTKQEARTAADVKAARLADEQLARDEAARQAAAAQQQSKLAAIYDYLFSKEPAAVAGVAAPSLAQAATQYRGDR
jgi:hypothetical protein